MKHFCQLVWDDLKRLYAYRILYFILILTFLFGMSMIFFPAFGLTNFLYVATFILPVIIFSISLFIEREEKSISRLISPTTPTLLIISSKITAALVLEMIPFVGFVVASLMLNRSFSNDIGIQYFPLFFAYTLGVVVHIIVGLSLSIIAKSSRILSLSYIAYIIVFSITPILYSNGIIPEGFQYFLIISPAFLSGVLLDTIISDALDPETWLILLSIFLQILYSGVLVWFVIRPFFKQFIALTDPLPQK